jgi:hypothetical protein
LITGPNVVLPDNAVVLLVHIPKCGGTSLIDVFGEIFGDDACFRHRRRKPGTGTYGPAIEDLDANVRSHLRFVAGHIPYGFHKFFDGEPIYLTVVRDPVDRLVSDYFFSRDRGAPKLKKITSSLSLDEYFEHKMESTTSRMLSNQQTAFVTGRKGAVFPDAKRRIDEDFTLACGLHQLDDLIRLLGVLFRTSLEPRKMNVTQSASRGGLSPENEHLCRTLNSEDVKLHEYVSRAFDALMDACSASSPPGTPD